MRLTTGWKSPRWVLAAALTLAGAGCAGVPREPEALPSVMETFAAPYELVWEATLASLGALKLPVADKAAGRILTEPFSTTVAQPGVGTTQVLWVALLVDVRPLEDGGTQVRVEPRVHHAFHGEERPGALTWGSLFARIEERLSRRGPAT